MENQFKNIITGKHIILRKVEVGDAADIFKWRSGESGKFLRQPVGYSIQGQVDWINSRTDKEINYIILSRKTQEKVGTIGIYDVNNEDKVANVGRLLLNETYLGTSNPFGLEALLLCYDYLFNEMLFRKMTGDILATNTGMVKLQKFLGMREEGFLEKHVVINGMLHDLHIMSIFKEEFNDKYKKKIDFLLKSFN